MREFICRRQFLAAGAAALVAPSVALSSVDDQDQGRSRSFRLKETAGLRRFGYPVHTILPAELTGPKFRLERDGMPIPAQFRKVEGTGEKNATALDFNASPGPLEEATFVVRSGDKIEPGPEPKKGMSVEQDGADFVVANGSELRFRLTPDKLGYGFLSSVRNGGTEYIRQVETGMGRKTSGFGFRAKDGTAVPFGGPNPTRMNQRVSITRNGPMAVGLRIDRTDKVDNVGTIDSIIDLTFPNSKSWVEGHWSIDDGEGLVDQMAVGVYLQTEGEPTLVDLGARGTVYGTLRRGEDLQLVNPAKGGGRWRIAKTVLKERGGERFRMSEPFASAPPGDTAPAEGWAHVMDRERCVAGALAEFGVIGRDQLQADWDGQLLFTRTFSEPRQAPKPGPKSLRFWYHFVSMPVQVGAATSPQAMLAPLVVDWL